MKTPSLILVLHWDMDGTYSILKNLDLEKIAFFAKQNEAMIISSPEKADAIFPFGESLFLTGMYPTWDEHSLGAFKGETVLLCGGYRSLCIRDAYNVLVKHGINVVICSDWIVSDPAWYTPDSAMRQKDGLSFIWEYPDSILYNLEKLTV